MDSAHKNQKLIDGKKDEKKLSSTSYQSMNITDETEKLVEGKRDEEN